MTEREKGLLVAAREARSRADELRVLANKLEDRGRHVAADKYAHIATRFVEFAEWCEVEANTYPGASLVLTP